MLAVGQTDGGSEDFGMKYLVMFLLICLGVSLGEKVTSPTVLYCLGFTVGVVTMAIYFLS
jgi:hypothetical protein